MATNTVGVRESVRIGDDFYLDPCAYELRRGDRRLKIERIPMELLLFLVEQRGRLVSREQIVQRVWGNDVNLATDASINAAVRKLRRVLRDDPDDPRYIQTVSGKGYRLIAPVFPNESQARAEDRLTPTPEPPALQELAPIPLTSELSELAPTASVRPRKRWIALGLSVLLLAAAALGYFAYSNFRKQPPAVDGKITVAILPFQNFTGDASQEYFSDGLTEELIAQMGHLDPQRLKVIARTSVMYYKSRQEPLSKVGRELGAQYVVDGSIRRDSERVRITAELIQVKDQSQVWSGEYDRPMRDVIALQGQVSHDISQQIQGSLGDARSIPAPLAPSTLSTQQYDAYEFYLRGQYLFNKRTPQTLQQAIEAFEKSIAANPADARAYAALSNCYALISGYDSSVTPRVVMPKAREAALRALQLDENLAEAHTALALVAQNYDWDAYTAEREYRRAIELNPNYATAHHWYGEFLGLQGRFDEALQQFELARQLDPLSLIIAADKGVLLYYARQYDRSIAQLRAVSDLEPNFPRSLMIVGPYVEKGMFNEALAEIRKTETVGGPAWVWSERVFIYGRAGDRGRARQAFAHFYALDKRKAMDATTYFMAELGIGHKDKALFWLKRAFDERSTNLTNIKVSPVFDPLRTDPAFKSLLDSMAARPAVTP